jgi:mRNA-degrading endonuclease toxin of MazEF toxin-antitoxin module
VEGLKQYEIWWADLPKPAGRRPVLLLTRDGAYDFLNKVVAAEITTTIRHIPVEIPLGPTEKLAKRCVANCDNLRTIPKQNLSAKISQLPSKRIAEVKRAVGYALGWEELIEARS